MRLHIDISSEAESKLKERAAAQGKDPTTYASEIVEEVVSRPSLDEILAPLRREFEESGMSDDQLLEQILAAQTEYRKQP
jgi:hypothetical protein